MSCVESPTVASSVKISSSTKRCTACAHYIVFNEVKTHPLLGVPICEHCYFHYNNGAFTVNEKNEIYCRFCGEGEGQLILCDSCPKSFCSRCIENAFGTAEMRRIVNISDRWHCIVCAPQPLIDLCTRNKWKSATPYLRKLKSNNNRAGLICHDVSKGREKFEIPVINTVDQAPPPLDFVYTIVPVAGEGMKLTNNPNFLACCSCTDNCRDPNRCECARRMGGFAYDINGSLVRNKACGIYECNSRCTCHKYRCNNRLVGMGPTLRLEVFRCENPAKGWGVRCRTHIASGKYICDYLGEILKEKDAENRGLEQNDEYLMDLEYWGRSCACQRRANLGMKRQIADISPVVDMDAVVTTEEEAGRCLDPAYFAFLRDKGVIHRALEIGEQLREDPASYLQRQRRELHHMQEEKKKDQQLMQKQQHKKPKAILSTGNESAKIDQSSSSETKLIDNHDNFASAANNSPSGDMFLQFQPTWADWRQTTRQNAFEAAQNVIDDRVMQEVDSESYVIDARHFGSVARFVNHSCSPNCDIKVVFCESHDPRLPRLALFANQPIPAGTEITYDYGYRAGKVQGKSKKCLCGSAECRKQWY